MAETSGRLHQAFRALSDMSHPRRSAIGLLLVGLVLALGTPITIALAAPHLAGYLLHPTILVGQAVPYVLCGVLWLPWRAPTAAMSAFLFAALMLLAAVVLYLPMLWAPGANGGDMIGLAFLMISAVTTAVLLLGSALTGLVLLLRRRGTRGPIC